MYIMTPGQSPFPSTAAGIKGPMAPLKTIYLDFDDDMLHDDCRVLGCNYELIDTTNALDQQGSAYSGGWDTQTTAKDQVIVENALAPEDSTRVSSNYCFVNALPPGDTASLVALNNNRIGKAKDGIFAHCRMDWSHCKPTFGRDGNHILYGPKANSSCPIDSTTALTIGDGWALANGAAYIGGSYQNSARGLIYKTALQMSATVFTGLKPTYSATIERKLTTQCFVPPSSKFKAFARLTHNPVDSALMDKIQNVMDATPEFWPSKDNANMKFFKAGKSLFDKVLRIAKPLASNAMLAMPGPVGNAARTVKLVQAASKPKNKNKTVDQAISNAFNKLSMKVQNNQKNNNNNNKTK